MFPWVLPFHFLFEQLSNGYQDEEAGGRLVQMIEWEMNVVTGKSYLLPHKNCHLGLNSLGKVTQCNPAEANQAASWETQLPSLEAEGRKRKFCQQNISCRYKLMHLPRPSGPKKSLLSLENLLRSHCFWINLWSPCRRSLSDKLSFRSSTFTSGDSWQTRAKTFLPWSWFSPDGSVGL